MHETRVVGMYPEEKRSYRCTQAVFFQNLKMLCRASTVEAEWSIAGDGKIVFQSMPGVGHPFHSSGVSGFTAVPSLVSHFFSFLLNIPFRLL